MGMIIDATIIMVEKLQTAAGAPAKGPETERVILRAAQEVGRPIVFAVAVIATPPVAGETGVEADRIKGLVVEVFSKFGQFS